MENIPFVLPYFYGLIIEDPHTFMFEFTIVCKTYDYTIDEKKLKLFQSTLKDETLLWFMSLGGDIITTWGQMKQIVRNRITVKQGILETSYFE